MDPLKPLSPVKQYSLAELSAATGLSPRLIRNYIQQGLLRSADTVGRNASYGSHHLDRLCVIRALRDRQGLSLAETRRRLITMTDMDVARTAEDWRRLQIESPVTSAATSAADYVRSLRSQLRARPMQDVSPAVLLMREPSGPYDGLSKTAAATSHPAVPQEGARRDQQRQCPEPLLRARIGADIELILRGAATPDRRRRLNALVDVLRRYIGKEDGDG